MFRKSTILPRAFAAASFAALASSATIPAFANEQAERPGPTWSEFAKLQQEVLEQRQLLIQLMQTEQQRYDMLLKLLSSQGSAATMPAVPSMPNVPTEEKRGKGPAPAMPAKTSEGRTGIVEGKVEVPGGDVRDVYVYVDGIRGPRGSGNIEIKQENKQFHPRATVVPIGTTVTFPNLDPVFHNVFSNSPTNPFDLGSYRAGDTTRSVVMSKPGVVDVFCNMHQRMSAHVLVVPNRHFAKVRPDGTFRIEGVPVGTRNLVVWSPSLRPAQRKVEVTAAGGRATFALEYTDPQAHTNKLGQPYGSYNE